MSLTSKNIFIGSNAAVYAHNLDYLHEMHIGDAYFTLSILSLVYDKGMHFYTCERFTHY